MVPGGGEKGRMEVGEKAVLSSPSPFHCLGSRELWEVEMRVRNLSAAFYKATCCGETVSHGSSQHSYTITSEWREPHPRAEEEDWRGEDLGCA